MVTGRKEKRRYSFEDLSVFGTWQIVVEVPLRLPDRVGAVNPVDKFHRLRSIRRRTRQDFPISQDCRGEFVNLAGPGWVLVVPVNLLWWVACCIVRPPGDDHRFGTVALGARQNTRQNDGPLAESDLKIETMLPLGRG